MFRFYLAVEYLDILKTELHHCYFQKKKKIWRLQLQCNFDEWSENYDNQLYKNDAASIGEASHSKFTLRHPNELHI